jgi:hypothetical protein
MINIRQTVSDDGGSLLEFKRRNPISQVVVYYVCRITKWSFQLDGSLFYVIASSRSSFRSSSSSSFRGPA